MFTPGSGDVGVSIDTEDESLLCLDVRKLIVLAASRWSPSVGLLSLFLLLEKRDRPPDDCLDLSADDIVAIRGDSDSTAECLCETRKNGQVLAQGRSHDERCSRGLCVTGSKGLPWQRDGGGSFVGGLSFSLWLKRLKRCPCRQRKDRVGRVPPDSLFARRTPASCRLILVHFLALPAGVAPRNYQSS